MPGMCLAVVMVAAMLVVGRGSTAAMVEKAAMAAAEEAAMSVVGRGSATATLEEAATAAAEEADDRLEIAPQNSET
jgi:hypothetical protein